MTGQKIAEQRDVRSGLVYDGGRQGTGLCSHWRGSPITQIDQQAIRDRAHAIWEREGRPSGRDRDHWLQAAWELAGEQARAAAASASKSPANKPRGKTRKGAKASK